MLLYLAEKTGKFLPADLYGRYDAIQWTFWQMGGLGPMAGQNHHFRNYAQEKIKYAIDRYVNETNRLYGVLNKRLSDREFIAGDYSIADMASYPWIVPYKNQEQNIDDFPHLKRWLETIAATPGHGARLCQGQGGQSEFRPARDPHRGRAQAAVRPDRGGGEVAGDNGSMSSSAKADDPVNAGVRGLHDLHGVLDAPHARGMTTSFVAGAPRNDGAML